MDQLKLLPEIGKTFFINDSEYKICFINNDKCRFSADPYTDIKITPVVRTKFMIEANSYIVTYVHESKKRITAEPLSIGY